MELRILSYFIAVAEELNVKRAAARLHMSQPPLSRAIQQLETELGAELFVRSRTGMTLTKAGAALLPEARLVVGQANNLREVVTGAAGERRITIGTLADSVEHVGRTVFEAYRARSPGVDIRIVEGDLTDPTVDLRSGSCDVVLTRGPFQAASLTVAEIRRDPVGVVLRDSDPLASRSSVTRADLLGRRWFRLPEPTDPLWSAYWTGGQNDDPQGPIVRTVRECIQSVLWAGAIGLAPLTIAPVPGITVVPVADLPPSPLVVAWRKRDRRPLVRTFAELALSVGRAGTATASAPTSTDADGLS
jgi:DNA-binding transcriptional LysR family regulator